MVNVDIPEDEVKEDLQCGGYMLLQKQKGFRFGIDAVLLSDFVNEKEGKMLDLCSGTSVIPILCIAKNKADRIEAVEILDEMADMASRSVIMNELSDRINIRCADLRNISDIYKAHSFDFVTCNPPYVKNNSGLPSPDDNRFVSRHEVCCTIDDVVRAASFCLNDRGRFYLVHRAYRLVDIFEALTRHKLEPKRLRFVAPSHDKEPTMVLIEAVRHGNRQLKVEPVLVINS